MNVVQNIIDRQLGINSWFNYDNILKRLVVYSGESFYGLQSPAVAGVYDQDPPIFACRFSEAPGYEHILALANEDGNVAIQNTATINTTSILEAFQCHNNAVFDLAWMPRHMNFVTVSGDHTACLWDVAEASPKRVLVFSSHTRSVKTAVFRPNEPSVFATGARDGHILIWDVRTSNQPCVILKPDNCLMNCHSSFTPKTPGSNSKRPRLDNLRATSITGLVYQDDMTLISCGECDGNIKVWDLRKNYNVYKREPLPKHSIPYCGSSAKNGYTNLIIDDAHTKLYASCMDNVIYCFNIATYNNLPEQRYVGHENSTFYIKTSLSSNSMYLVSGSSDKNAYIWNVKYPQPIVKLVGHWAEVTCAAWCQKGDMKIVTCSDDARHKIWRIGREFPEEAWELKGTAEVVPRTDLTTLPQWGGQEKTPSSSKRKIITTPGSFGSKRLKTQDTTSVRKTKRCLVELMNESKENDDVASPGKKIRLQLRAIPECDKIPEKPLLPAGIKRRLDIDDSPTKHFCVMESLTNDWGYVSPIAGTSFMTPTKKYEKKSCRKLSPRSPKPCASFNRSPSEISPSKVRTMSFSPPTRDLPNFVLTGEAPHLRLMSPVKRKLETTDWLTQMGRDKKGKGSDLAEKLISTISEVTNSTTDKTPKSNNKSRTLLEYFNVITQK